MHSRATIFLIILIGTVFPQAVIDYMQLGPSLITNSSDTDCQAVITYNGESAIGVKYLIWDSTGSRKTPAYSDSAECIGTNWVSGKLCHSGYFDPVPLTGVITCLFEISHGDQVVTEQVAAARVCETNCPPGCGDGVCVGNESTITCAQDCLPYRIEMEILSPKENIGIKRGEEVQLIVELKNRDGPVGGAELYASGFFGEISMDEVAGEEGMYWGKVVVSEDSDGPGMIEFKVHGEDSIEIKHVIVKVIPKIDLELDIKDTYSLGEIVFIEPVMKSIVENVGGTCYVELHNSVGKTVYRKNATAINGSVSFSYHSSLVEEIGDWNITLECVDSFGNLGEWSGSFDMVDVEPGSFLEIVHLGPIVGAYKRGSTVSVTVRVLREGSSVSGADVFFLSPSNGRMDMKEVSDGVYGSPYTIQWSDSVGTWRITSRASLKTDSGIVEGSTYRDISITPAPIDITVLRPNKGEFGVGETVEIMVKAEYPNGELANITRPRLILGEKEINMKEVSVGTYRTYYKVEDSEFDEILFTINMEDAHYNAGSKRFALKVTGTSVSYYFEQYGYIVAFLILAGVIWIWLYFKRTSGHMKKEKLVRRKEELIHMKKNLQVRYLKEGSIDRKAFQELNDEYEEELDRLEQELEDEDND